MNQRSEKYLLELAAQFNDSRTEPDGGRAIVKFLLWLASILVFLGVFKVLGSTDWPVISAVSIAVAWGMVLGFFFAWRVNRSHILLLSNYIDREKLDARRRARELR